MTVNIGEFRLKGKHTPYEMDLTFDEVYIDLFFIFINGYFSAIAVFECFTMIMYTYLRGGVAQWAARLTRNVKVVGSSPIDGPRCFLEQETLPLLLSTGWFHERILA